MKLSIRLGPLLLLLTLSAIQCIHATDSDDEAKVSLSERQLKEQPIVIETKARDYDQPNLKEFQSCHENRDKCMQICAKHFERAACESECPTCPILVNHEVLVQGINDTDYRAPAEIPGNTTNIIHLTNQIRNIIENSHNVSALNTNNVHVHQNITTTGGKYGLGQSDKGPCCMVLRKSKCNRRSGEHCRPKRHRLCNAEKCKARVMYAKPVQHCTEDSTGDDKCTTRMKYVPIKRSTVEMHPKCRYIEQWPYVHCPINARQPQRSAICKRCLRLPYGYILNSGMPHDCQPCYAPPSRQHPEWRGGYAPVNPSYSQMYPLYQPAYPQPYPNMYPQFSDNFYPNENDGWELDNVKCRLADGSISSDCGDAELKQDDSDNVAEYSPNDLDPELEELEAESPSKPDQGLMEGPDDTDEDDDYYEYDVPLTNMRLRRQNSGGFKRSSYSRRNTMREL